MRMNRENHVSGVAKQHDDSRSGVKLVDAFSSCLGVEVPHRSVENVKLCGGMRVELEVRPLVAKEIRILQVGREEVGFFVEADRYLRMRSQIEIERRCSGPWRSYQEQVRLTQPISHLGGESGERRPTHEG